MHHSLLGNVAVRIADREFDGGMVENERKIERFADFTPTEIVLYFGQDFFELIQTCTNEIPDANITMKELYCYHALLILMTVVRLDQVYQYYYPPDIIEFKGEVNIIKAHLPKAKYFRLRKQLRAYQMENDVPGKGVGWKIERAVAEVNRVFRSTMDCPGRDISIDEGMGAQLKSPTESN